MYLFLESILRWAMWLTSLLFTRYMYMYLGELLYRCCINSLSFVLSRETLDKLVEFQEKNVQHNEDNCKFWILVYPDITSLTNLF